LFSFAVIFAYFPTKVRKKNVTSKFFLAFLYNLTLLA